MPRQEEETVHVSYFTCGDPVVEVLTPELSVTENHKVPRSFPVACRRVCDFSDQGMSFQHGSFSIGGFFPDSNALCFFRIFYTWKTFFTFLISLHPHNLIS